MNFQRRRGLRGAVRATPEEILQLALTRHKALRDREQLCGEAAVSMRPSAKTAPRCKADDDARRAQFAAAMARAVFGRFYQTARRKKGE